MPTFSLPAVGARARLAEERTQRKREAPAALPPLAAPVKVQLEQMRRRNEAAALSLGQSLIPSRSTFVQLQIQSRPQVQHVQARGELSLALSLPSTSRWCVPAPLPAAEAEATPPSPTASLPCEVRFVTQEDARRTWYPRGESPRQQGTRGTSTGGGPRKFRRLELKISTTPASAQAPSSRRSSGVCVFPLAIDAGRVVAALRMATDMNPMLRAKYMEFFQGLLVAKATGFTPHDPFASEGEGSSESLL